MKKILLGIIFLGVVFLTPNIYGAGESSFNGTLNSDLEVGTNSIDGDSTSGLAIDPDNDGVDEVTLSKEGNITTTGDLIVNGDDIFCDGDLIITPTGADVLLDSGLTVGSTTEAGDNNLRVEGNSVFIGDITIGTTGVKLSDDGDGAITFLGLGDGFDEDLTINFDDTSDQIDISSSTGVATVDFGTINLATDGLDLSEGNITNVGDVALSSISSNTGTTVTVNLGTDAGDDFLVGNNNALVVEGDSGKVGIGTATPETTFHTQEDDANASTVTDIVTIEKTTSGTPAAGIGAGIVFKIEDAGGSEEQASIDVSLSDVTDGSEDADIVFKQNITGAVTETLRLDADGGLKWTQNSDTLTFFNDGTDNWVKMSGNYLKFQNSVSNADSNVHIKGNGTGSASLTLWDGSSDYTYTIFKQVDGDFETYFGANTTKYTINSGGRDTDFIVLDDYYGNAIYVDAGNSRVGIYTDTPGTTFEVNGLASVSVDADTIADTGDANPATHTLTPSTSYVELTCNDADTCDITMGETGITEGTGVTIVNVSANVCDFADTAGVSELAGAFAMGQYDTLKLVYIGDRWVEVSRSDN